MAKAQTIFCDLDGVLIQHRGGASTQWFCTTELVQDADQQLNRLEKAGCHIVLVTARPEHMRVKLVELLQDLCLPYHQLVMGITSGERWIVNDSKPNTPLGKIATAFAATVLRNDSKSLVKAVDTILGECQA